MAVPTIEQFIERSKVNCRASANLTVKRRFMQSLNGTEGDVDAAEKFAEYIASPEGAKAVEEALNAGKFYRALASENAVNEPRVVSAYEKYVSGILLNESEQAENRKKAKNKRKKQNRKNNKLAKRQGYFAKYLEYVITAEDETRIVSSVANLIRGYYSDIARILPPRFMKELRSEFVNESMLGRLMRRMYDEAALNTKRVDNVIAKMAPVYTDLNGFIKGYAVMRVVEDSGYSAATKNGMIREFLDMDKQRYGRIGEMYAKIIKLFGRDKMTEIITGGEGYKALTDHAHKQIKLSESAHELILREIPENVIELYPGARSMRRHFILHLGPTNSGKTYDSLQACMNAETGVYLAPLRLLAYEICEKFNIEGVPCRMKTGEEEIDVPFASHISSTVEMLNTNEHYDVAVVDECQLIEDEERGGAWTAAILGLMADEIHLCASENAEWILTALIDQCGDTYEVIRHKRSVPLKCDSREFVFPESVEPRDALIAFSKRGVLYYAEQLRQLGIRSSVIYGDLPYDVRRSEVSRFVKGETDVVVATDAVGMGLNLPIKRVVFLETYKYDGHRRRFLRGSEVKQIAGRAGRMGMYDVGLFNSAEFKSDICKKLQKHSHDVKYARLRIPESILAVDMPLSEILLRWGTMPDDDIFAKNSVEREVMLCRELEKLSSDKYLIYRFVTIPFAETHSELYEFWLELFEREISGERGSVYSYIRTLERRGKALEDHELAYRKCDILYFYFDRFGVKEDLNAIMDLKHSISADIMNILSGAGSITAEPSGE